MANADQTSRSVWIIDVNAAISPSTSDFIVSNLHESAENNATLFILRLDTPGGLSASMRVIIKEILASPIPVVTYVAPKGARAASAGTYILYASHVAAMAPATNLGAATPVQLGPPIPQPKPVDSEKNKKDAPSKSPMEKKQLNDAVAYIQGLAKLHNRNEEWAEEAVLEGASLTSTDALDKNVIDLIAKDIDDLLLQLDGRELTLNERPLTLSTLNLEKIYISPDWRNQFLGIITNPNVAYILMLLGIYGLIFEFYNPGIGLPGIVGAISLLVAGYALQMLPLNYAGVALILLGIALMMTEAFMPSFGVFGIGGIIAFATGSVFLFDTDIEVFRVALPLIASLTMVSFMFLVLLLNMVLRTRRKSFVSGIDTLIGAHAIAIEDFDEVGMVKIEGELWKAITSKPLSKGSRVKINSINGLQLLVESDPEE
ncbi:MAG: serine protease [Moraxellaceae bacterium]|nr:MAG: serine protease [Moraxellaceae bacterium]